VSLRSLVGSGGQLPAVAPTELLDDVAQGIVGDRVDDHVTQPGSAATGVKLAGGVGARRSPGLTQHPVRTL